MQNKIKILSFLLIFGFLIVLSKLFYWQVFEQKKLKILAEGQYQFSKQLTSKRGKIFSSDGFPLATSKYNYLMFADLSLITLTSDELTDRFKNIVILENIDKEKLSDKNNLWFPLKDGLDEEIKKSIENLNIKGIFFDQKEIRYYPEASMSAHLLGFVGNDDEGNDIGYFGLEGYYDKELKGKTGKYIYEKDALGDPLPLGETKEESLIEGRSLELHLDRGLQFIIEKKLKEGIEKYKAVSGSVVVVNPNNGAILSMASLPKFDPGNYVKYNQEVFRNPVISSIFEPGSIFKVITMASALDGGFVKENDYCDECSGPKTINDYTIKTWNEKYYPDSSMTDIIVHSDNVGMVYVINKMGLKNFFSYLGKFNLTEKTGIDLQGEVSSKIKPQNQWGKIELATASFGQGIALTQIEILSAISAIANGGEIYKPQVVSKIKDPDGEVSINPEKIKRSISKNTAEIVTKMMIKAVEEGESKWAKPKGYQIAGKTGTAQIPVGGKYDPEKTVASFVGFAPAENPRFAMLVVLNEPKSSVWGSETAAPLWFSIATDIFRLWNIPPQ